jgi:hypothetical protein
MMEDRDRLTNTTEKVALLIRDVADEEKSGRLSAGFAEEVLSKLDDIYDELKYFAIQLDRRHKPLAEEVQKNV